jgi:DNA-binding MarR family transcriptional regulator
MTDQPPTLALPPERQERRAEILRLTQAQAELYNALTRNSAKRDELILAEMDEPENPAIARDIAELVGVSVGRIYKLRDNAKSRK